MKCSKCGKRFNSLPAMAKHYRKKHPASMKRKSHLQPKVQRRAKSVHIPGASGSASGTGVVIRFCPHCGGFLG